MLRRLIGRLDKRRTDLNFQISRYSLSEFEVIHKPHNESEWILFSGIKEWFYTLVRESRAS